MVNTKQKKESNFPLKLGDLRPALEEQAKRHGYTITQILISGGWKEVRRLEAIKPTIETGEPKASG